VKIIIEIEVPDNAAPVEVEANIIAAAKTVALQQYALTKGVIVDGETDVQFGTWRTKK
jgi:hypothetical protein